MVDIFSRRKRSPAISRIRSKNAEGLLEARLKETGIGYVKYPKIFGNPDFLIKNKDVVIFVDGCIWSKCPKHHVPQTKSRTPKILINSKRDRKVFRHLKKGGYNVIRFSEHEIEDDMETCMAKLNSLL